MKQESQRISRFISLILRHSPETIGLELDSAGWANIDELIELSNVYGKIFNHKNLEYLVETSGKQRFSISTCGTRIRANHGHSIRVNIINEDEEPPAHLFHGTARRFVKDILAAGITPQTRQFVHLSTTKKIAKKVGRRHGKPVVLHIDSNQMSQDGYKFFCSASGVWLTDHVPLKYISL